MSKTPQRRCVGCYEMKDKSSLIRVVSNENGISPDETKKAPGRGAYVCNNDACLKKAYKSKGLERSFKRAVPPEIYSQLGR